jgi:hypothetical protein
VSETEEEMYGPRVGAHIPLRIFFAESPYFRLDTQFPARDPFFYGYYTQTAGEKIKRGATTFTLRKCTKANVCG